VAAQVKAVAAPAVIGIGVSSVLSAAVGARIVSRLPGVALRK